MKVGKPQTTLKYIVSTTNHFWFVDKNFVFHAIPIKILADNPSLKHHKFKPYECFNISFYESVKIQPKNLNMPSAKVRVRRIIYGNNQIFQSFSGSRTNISNFVSSRFEICTGFKEAELLGAGTTFNEELLHFSSSKAVKCENRLCGGTITILINKPELNKLRKNFDINFVKEYISNRLYWISSSYPETSWETKIDGIRYYATYKNLTAQQIKDLTQSMFGG